MKGLFQTASFLKDAINDHKLFLFHYVKDDRGLPTKANGAEVRDERRPNCATVWKVTEFLTERSDLVGESVAVVREPSFRNFKVDAVEIHWPDGKVEKVQLPAVDRIFTVEEGTSATDHATVTSPK